MTGLVNNYDALCYHLKVVRFELDSPNKNKIDSFLEAMRQDLLESDIQLLDLIEAKYSRILDLRIAALKQLSSEEKDFTELLNNEVYPYFERLTEIHRLSNLSENVLFALRTNRKVINSLIKNIAPEELSKETLINLPEEISYDQFVSLCFLILPTVEAANIMIDWMKCSFQIEYIICATAMIFDDKLMVSPQRIDELSSIIVEAAQTYSAIAMEIGILPFNNTASSSPDVINDVAFSEQKNLAEAGIYLFAKNWNN